MGGAGTGAGTSDGGTPSASLNPRDYITDDGKLKPGWAKVFNAPDAFEKKFTELKSAFGSHGSLEKLINAKGILPPGPNATTQEKDAFYKALGRPDKPEEYAIKMPEKIGDKPFPKELWNQEQAGAFAKWAHEHGWSRQQVQDAIEYDATRGLSAHEAATQSHAKAQTDAVAALKAEWGAKYGDNLKLAQQAAKEAGGDALLADPVLANNPAFIRAMAKVGAMIVEDPAAGARGTRSTTMNPEAEIAAIMGDKNHPWQPQNAKLNPKAHDDAVKYMQRLYQLKNGEAA